MPQSKQSDKSVKQIAQALKPHFDQTRLMLAQQIAQAEDGYLIEQTERPIFEALNRLKTTTQQVSLQERIQVAESAFSPSGQAGKTAP